MHLPLVPIATRRRLVNRRLWLSTTAKLLEAALRVVRADGSRAEAITVRSLRHGTGARRVRAIGDRHVTVVVGLLVAAALLRRRRGRAAVILLRISALSVVLWLVEGVRLRLGGIRCRRALGR